MSQLSPNTVEANSVPRNAPGPRFSEAVFSGLLFWHDPIRVLEGATERYGDMVRVQIGKGQVLHLIHQPEHTEHVLLKNNRNYQKSSPFGLLKLLFGRGLLFNEGESWFAQRRLMQPAFQPKQFSQLAEDVGGVISSTVGEWQKHSDGKQTNIEDEMSYLSRRIIGRVLFGINVPDEIYRVLEPDGGKMAFMLGNVPYSPHNFRCKAAIKKLDETVYDIIRERRNTTKEVPVDILSSLLTAADKETGETMSDEQLRDEIVTLLFSGFDTTSRTLTWAFHALSQHPEVEKRLHEELQSVLGGRTATYEDVAKLTYTQMLVKETLRVFPANPIIGRQAKEDDVIGGYHIPAGSFITLSPYLAHHSPKLWKDPEIFDPERFTPENESTQTRFSYFPFGGGPRQCIGKGLAMMTIPMAIASIAQQYQFRAIPGFTVERDMQVTLQSRRGVLATRHLRPSFGM